MVPVDPIPCYIVNSTGPESDHWKCIHLYSSGRIERCLTSGHFGTPRSQNHNVQPSYLMVSLILILQLVWLVQQRYVNLFTSSK
ncbi:hypothetical protein Mapa_016305 [Marchantia paleacea]|nr:hypothetical protein Mapa_016305 [Marchantia paleacea]